MNITKKRIIKSIAFVLTACCMLLVIADVMKQTESTANCNINGFYTEPENSLDAVFIGASEVYTGIAPTQLWKEQHFTSYCMASPGAPGQLYKTLLKETLRKQKPKVIVVEVNGFIAREENATNEGSIRNIIDNLHWSDVKLDAIRDTIDKEERIYYYLPFLKYHSGWHKPVPFIRTAFVKNVFRFKGISYLKGVSTYTSVEKSKEVKKVDEVNFGRSGRQNLRDFLEFCKEEKLENVLFLRAPHKKDISNPEMMELAWKLIEAYGYPVLDCSDSNPGASWGEYENVIDPETDYYNVEHLNYYGMKKFTSFLGNYLEEKYHIGDGEHSKELKERWDLCAGKADELFQACVADMEKNWYCHYFEYSIYRTPKDLSKKLIVN